MSLERHGGHLEREELQHAEIDRGEDTTLNIRLHKDGCKWEPIDLSAVSEIEVRLEREDALALVKRLTAGAIRIVNGPLGRFQCDLTASDTQTLKPSSDGRFSDIQVTYTLAGKREIVTIMECVEMRNQRFPQDA